MFLIQVLFSVTSKLFTIRFILPLLLVRESINIYFFFPEKCSLITQIYQICVTQAALQAAQIYVRPSSYSVKYWHKKKCVSGPSLFAEYCSVFLCQVFIVFLFAVFRCAKTWSPMVTGPSKRKWKLNGEILFSFKFARSWLTVYLCLK